MSNDDGAQACSLYFQDCTLESMMAAETWRAICPFLTCSTEGLATAHSSAVGGALTRGAHESLCSKGFFQINACQIKLDTRHAALTSLLARGVLRLMEMGYSPCFLLMYNECWEMTRIVSEFMLLATDGQNAPLGDFYVFTVLSARQTAAAALNPRAFVHRYSPGPPHRDRPSAGAASFTDDLTPHYVSTWLALTPATTANSCLYCVPLARDAGYYTEGDARGQAIRVQDVLAKPLRQGAFLAFSHRLLHWGGALQPELEEEGEEGGEGWEGRKEAEEEEEPPRIALTNAHALKAFEEAYYNHDTYPHDGTTPLGLRLGLACGQQIQYAHLASLKRYELALLRRLFHSQKFFFSASYFEKISSACQMLTFVLKQQRGRGGP